MLDELQNIIRNVDVNVRCVTLVVCDPNVDGGKISLICRYIRPSIARKSLHPCTLFGLVSGGFGLRLLTTQLSTVERQCDDPVRRATFLILFIDQSSSDGDDLLPPPIPFLASTSAYAGRILSMITERTEPTMSRPLSGIPRPDSSVPETFRRSSRFGGAASPSQHLRSSTDPAADRPTPPQGHRAGELIAFFEDKRADGGGHPRIASAPAGPRSSSPHLPSASQSTPMISSTAGHGTGLGLTTTGYSSRSSSPTKRHSCSSASSVSSTPHPISSLILPPLRGLTSLSARPTRERGPLGRSRVPVRSLTRTQTRFPIRLLSWTSRSTG